MTTRLGRWALVLAVGATAAPALAQDGDRQQRGASRQRTTTSPPPAGGGGAITPTPPADQRVPIPGDRQAPPPRPAPDNSRPDTDRPRDGGRDDRPRTRYPRRPYGYYDYWVNDRSRYYDDGYRGYDPPAAPPADRGYDRAVDGERPADEAMPPGAALPPEDLMGDDDDAPAELRKALESSPEYREATAELLRAWAEYTKVAEGVIGRLRSTAPYQRAQAALREAEAKVARVRDRDRGAPAVNLVTAAQQAMLARRAVRNLEEKAIDVDSTARRAKQRVDDAVDRRNKVRDEIRQKLGGAAG